MLVNFFRVFKLGWQEFLRNIGISMGTVFIMFIALSLVAGTLFLKGINESLITTLKEKVDISVYFNLDAEEDNVLKVKERIENFPQVEEVEYVSREKALETFKEKHKNDSQIMEALAEIGENPLPNSLNIRASTKDAYAAVSNFLEKGEFKKMIDKVNYRQNQLIIGKLFSVADFIKKGGLSASFILIFIAVAVTFNTVRLAIYSKKREIEIMKLIGATDLFVRGPFLIQGIILGLLGGFLSFLFFYGVNTLFPFQASGIFGELGFLNFFEKNILLLLLIQFGGGVFLGITSSFLAAQKYLKA
jgi:cell division transport system permease protein